MSELLGITGAIGSGKTTVAKLLGEQVQNHASYESSLIIAEAANRLNQLLEAELNFETTDDDTELVNQALIWMPDVITEYLHHDTTWNHLAITPKDQRAHPELYAKLFAYLQQVKAEPKLVEQTITSKNKDVYRALLQWLGGYFIAKISPTIWYDEIFRRIDVHDSRADLVIIGGLRYVSDATLVRQHGGRIIAVIRPGAEPSDADITEAERNKIVPDVLITNNGTLDQLAVVIETVWNDIAAGKPRREYRAV